MILNVIYHMIHYNQQFVHLRNGLLMKIQQRIHLMNRYPMKNLFQPNIFHHDNIKYLEHHFDMIQILRVQRLKILMMMMMKMFMIPINQHFFKKFNHKLLQLNKYNLNKQLIQQVQVQRKKHKETKVKFCFFIIKRTFRIFPCHLSLFQFQQYYPFLYLLLEITDASEDELNKVCYLENFLFFYLMNFSILLF